MLKHLFIILFFIFTTVASAAFEFQEASCSLSSTQNLNFQGTPTFSSRVRIEMSFSEELRPIYKLIFLEVAPESVSVSWNSIQFQRDNLSFFTDDLMPFLRTFENQEVSMPQTRSFPDPLTFETQPVNLMIAQTMVALFLTQNNMNVIVRDKNGNTWTALLSLRSSDSSYRQLAARCFQAQSSAYLSADGQRLANNEPSPHLTAAAPAVSTGYGLVDFTTLLQLSPINISWSEITETAPLVELLSEKKRLVDQLTATTSSEDLQSASQEVRSLLETQKTLSERLSLISAPTLEGSEGLLLLKEQEEASLLIEIAEVENKMKDLQESLLSLDTETQQNAAALLPFLDPLNDFENKNQSMQSEIASLSGYIRDIESLLQSYQDQLPSEFFAENASESLLSSPWSLEEIERRKNELAPEIQIFRTLTLMREQLASLRVQFDGLKTQVQEVEAITTQMLELQSQKSEIEHVVLNNDSEIQKMTSMPYIGNLDSIQFSVLLSLTEADLSINERSYDDEFLFHEQEFNKLSGRFKEIVTANSSKIWSPLICDWNQVLERALDTKALNCLIVSDFLSESTRRLFLEKLSPQALDSMIDIPVSPWTQPMSKIDYVGQRVDAELNQSQSTIESLLQIEQMIRMILWRWNSQQKTLDEVSYCASEVLNQKITRGQFSQTFYEQMFQCENQRLQNLLMKQDQLFTESLAASINLKDAEDRLAREQTQLTIDTVVFTEAVSQLLEKSQNAALLETYYNQCLDLSTGLSECEESFTQQIQFQSRFTEQMLEMDLNIRSRSLLLQSDLASKQSEVEDLIRQKDEFIKTNNIETLIVRKEELASQLIATQSQIQELNELLLIKQQSLTENQEAQTSLQAEASQIIAQQTMLALQIKNIQNLWSNDCLRVEELRTELAAIDQRIIQWLSSETTTAEPQIPSHPLLILCQ